MKGVSLVKATIEDMEKEIEELEKKIPAQQRPAAHTVNNDSSSRPSKETLSDNLSVQTSATEQKSVSDQKKSSSSNEQIEDEQTM